MEKILKSEEVVVTRRESSFDRACDEAYSRACMVMGIDDDGHSRRVKGWDRSSCSIRLTFQRYELEGGMGGPEHTYIFLAEAVEYTEEE